MQEETEFDRLERQTDEARWLQTFPDRKAKIEVKIGDLKKLLDRDPPPSYNEVSRAIDEINRPNDKP